MFTAIAYDRTDLKTAIDSGINGVELRLSNREALDWINELTIKEAELINSIKLYQDDYMYTPINIASISTVDVTMLKKAFCLASTVTYLKPSKTPVKVVTSLLTGLDAFCALDPNGDAMKNIKTNIAMLLSAFPNTKLLIENTFSIKGMSSPIDLHMFMSFMCEDQIPDRIRLRFNSENAARYSEFCALNTPDDDNTCQTAREYEKYFYYLYRYMDDVEFSGNVFLRKPGTRVFIKEKDKECLKTLLESYRTYLNGQDILINTGSCQEDNYLLHKDIANIISSLLSSQRIPA